MARGPVPEPQLGTLGTTSPHGPERSDPCESPISRRDSKSATWALSGKILREIGRAFAVEAFAVSKGIRRAEEMRAADRQLKSGIQAILTTFRT